MMSINEIAKAFGMSVAKFANYMGYSRQAMYDKKSGRNRMRLSAAVERLTDLNNKLYDLDMSIANKSFSTRENAIRAFVNMFEEVEE